MKERILVLDHPVYGLAPEVRNFVTQLFFDPHERCKVCSSYGVFVTNYHDFKRCSSHIMADICDALTNCPYASPEYFDYWINLYTTAIKKFLRDYPDLALES